MGTSTLSQSLQAGIQQGLITITTGDAAATGNDVIAAASDVIATEEDIKPLAGDLMVAVSDVTPAGTNQNEALSDPNNEQGAGDGIQVKNITIYCHVRNESTIEMCATRLWGILCAKTV